MALSIFRSSVALSDTTAIVPLRAAAASYGIAYAGTTTIGGQDFELLFDTGSSDTWVLAPGWKCYEKNVTGILGEEIPQSECGFPDVTYSADSATASPLENAWLGIHYGLGDVLGTLGTDDVALGSVTLPDQEIGIANATNGPSDGLTNGILGLGYPILSQTHAVDYSAQTSLELIVDRLPSKTVVASLVDEYAQSWFAFALERLPAGAKTGPGGSCGFGVLPDVAHTEEWTTLPVEVTKALPSIVTNNDTSLKTYWTTTVQSVEFKGTNNSNHFSTPYQAVVDTGTYYSIVPQALAAGVAAAFIPPGSLDPSGLPFFLVECNATLPSDVSMTLGGTSFTIASEDLRFQSTDGTCYSSIAPSASSDGPQLYFLGGHFLRNVVSVFDIAKNEMRFAARMNEGAPGSPPTDVPVQETNDATIGRGTISACSLAIALSSAF